MTFRAIRIDKHSDDATQTVALTDVDEADLMPGEVTVAVEYSTVNYKDGLALTGAAPVVRQFPMIPGIDFAGRVIASQSPDWSEGDLVVVNGWGMGETHWGGYGEKARVPADWPVRLTNFDARQAMAIGTAGYTAMLSVMALERAEVTPDKGPVLVTGAAGGVGSVAVAVLAKLGYEVLAATGRESEADYLRGLGAKEIIPREELAGKIRPLGKERWAGAVDSVGSTILANVLGGTKYGGAVAACGLAMGMDLPGSVAPFILRGVNLLGIESVYAPRALREKAWERLGRDLDPALLETMINEVSLETVADLGPEILAGKVRGRTVVKILKTAQT